MIVRVYIDGFNLYYGALRKTRYKWLDLDALCRRLLPDDQIDRIKYFTARVSGTAKDPNVAQRQQIYFRALRAHIPRIQIIEGHFLESHKRAPLADTGQIVRVLYREEKGSDVNLAVHLLNDAWRGKFEGALVISNDSDLAEGIRLVRKQLNLPVGVCNPILQKKRRMAAKLNQVATFRTPLTVAQLSACQLPSPIPGTKIHKPAVW